MEGVELSYAEKLELVKQAYERTLDIETAFAQIDLTADERKKLEADEELQASMSVAKAREYEKIVGGIRTIAHDPLEKSGIKLAALKELGKVMRPDKFKDNVNVDMNMTYRIIPRNAAGND